MNAADLAKLASYPGAPPVERLQARAELERTFHPTTSDLPPMSDVQKLVNLVQAAWEHDDLLKARQVPGVNAWPTTPLVSAKPKPGQPMAVMVDEFGLFGSASGGYRLRPSQFGTESLRLMVEHTPLINAIILRRCRTISRFLRPVERNRDIYFEVRKNDEGGTIRPRKGPTETALEQFLLGGGWSRDPARRREEHRESLSAFITKSLRDILTLDGWAIETVPTRNRRTLASFHAVDAGTIFLASEQGYEGNEAIRSVQIVHGLPVRGFTAEEMIYAVQTPRSDIRYYGYGYPPPEMVVRVVTGYLNALTYNLRGFDSNAIPKGMLTLFGNFDADQLRFFKQNWNAMVRGVNNAWALPVMISESQEGKAHFEKFGVEFSEMYFAKWMTFLTSVICAVYGMDPTEIYSESFHSGRSSLSGSDVAEKLADARDTGLEPIMAFLEETLTDSLIARIEPDYVVRFVGLHPVDQQRQHEVDKLVLSRNQLAEKYGYEQIKESWGDAPLNPVLQQAWLMGQGGAAGMPGGEGKQPAPEADEREDRKDDEAKQTKPSGTAARDQEHGDDEDDARRPGQRAEMAARDKRAQIGVDEPASTLRKAMTGDVLVVG